MFIAMHLRSPVFCKFILKMITADVDEPRNGKVREIYFKLEGDKCRGKWMVGKLRNAENMKLSPRKRGYSSVHGYVTFDAHQRLLSKKVSFAVRRMLTTLDHKTL